MTEPPVPLTGLRRIWTHPVVHFLLIGAVLFGLNAWHGAGRVPADEAAITVDRPRLEALAGIWRAQFGRRPTEAELTTVASSRRIDPTSSSSPATKARWSKPVRMCSTPSAP